MPPYFINFSCPPPPSRSSSTRSHFSFRRRRRAPYKFSGTADGGSEQRLPERREKLRLRILFSRRYDLLGAFLNFRHIYIEGGLKGNLRQCF